MSRIMNYLLGNQEKPLTESHKSLEGQFEQYLAPECELPPDYQASIDREYADKGFISESGTITKEWWKELDKNMATDKPPF